MNTITTFFRTLFKSSTSPAYYNDVVRAPLSFSWKYFFSFNFLAALVTGVMLMVPVALFDLVGNVSQLTTVFPSELVVTGDERGLTINQELPYTVPFSLFDPDAMSEEGEVPSNLMTFTSDEAIQGIKDVQDLDSLFVLTSTTAYVLGDGAEQEMRVYPIPEFTEAMTLDRPLIDSFMTQVMEHPILKNKLYIPLLLLVAVLFIYPGILLMRVVTLAVYASIVWVIAKLFMKEKGFSWSQVFQISIHSITPIVVFAYLLGVLSFLFFSGTVYFLAFLIWTLYVMSQIKKLSPIVEGEVVHTTTPITRKSVKAQVTKRAKKK